MGRLGRVDASIFMVTVLAFMATALAPVAVFAQIGASGIAGVVRDTSGAVLPGVAVEAASPALIERVRIVVSDERGEYKIINLVPGVYSVTFTLSGFGTVKREGIELGANFTSALNVDLQVGTLAETVTVSGASPVVDVQNLSNNTILTTEVLTSVPLAKTTQTLFSMMPSVVQAPSSKDVGGSLGEYSTHGSVHGAKGSDEALLLDGMRFNPFLGTTSYGLYPNPAGAEEIVIESAAGGSAEYTLAGLQMNLIPKSGGNRFSGFLFANYAGSGFESNNLTTELQNQGLTTVNKVENVYDVNGALGGPIRQDKLWFFTAHRRWGTSSAYPNFYPNLTQGTNIYSPDLAHATLPVEVNRSNNVRLTWQVSPKNKFTLYVDNQASCNCPNNETTLVSPEATSPVDRGPIFLYQTTWSNVASSKVLFEAGFTAVQFQYTKGVPPGVGPNDHAITDRGFTFQSPTSLLLSSEPDTYSGRGSMSYVTGSHHFKTGFSIFEGTSHNITARNGGMNYTFLSGVPQSLTEFVSPLPTLERQWPTYSIYAQDQWTLKRLTMTYGLRMEALREYVPAEQQPAIPQFGIPARSFPQVTCVPCWKDLNPRFAAAYDLFGDGKTALKTSLGRYVAAEANSISLANDPVNATISSATRSWSDDNHNLQPDCDLTSPLKNGECGPLNPGTIGGPKAVNVYDPAVLNGWNKRGYSWMFSTRVDQQLRPNVGVSAGYYRTWYGNFLVTHNQLVKPTDFSQYCITAPMDPRLPGGGGNPICGLYDINPLLFGQTQNLITFASNFGNQTEIYNGVDLTVNAHFAHGALVSGGVNIGNQNNSQVNGSGAAIAHTNNCFVVDSPQQAGRGLTTNPVADAGSCDVRPGYTTQLKVVGSYTLRWDVAASVSFQSLPGPVLAAAYPATTAEIAPSLGRPLAGGTKTATIQLLTPFSELGPRINQTDVRLAKTFRMGTTRIKGMFDVYNLLNSSAVLQNNINWGSNWLQPTVILNGRLAKFGVQLEF
jgi:Carboxypeptidase regulatory-like domain